MKLDPKEIVWMNQIIFPKLGEVWGWFYCGNLAYKYDGKIELVDNQIAFHLTWESSTSGYEGKGIFKTMEALKRGDLPQVGSTETMSKLLFDADFKKLVINSLVYHKLQSDVD
jgi:hypothetical protein